MTYNEDREKLLKLLAESTPSGLVGLIDWNFFVDKILDYYKNKQIGDSNDL
jgi:hypothetical protein